MLAIIFAVGSCCWFYFSLKATQAMTRVSISQTLSGSALQTCPLYQHHDLPVNKCWDHEPHSLTFLHGTPQLLKHRLLKVASLSIVPSSHSSFWSVQSNSDADKIDKLVGFALGVSVARRAPPLIIMGWALSVGSVCRLQVRQALPHSQPFPESANWHHRTEYLSCLA